MLLSSLWRRMIFGHTLCGSGKILALHGGGRLGGGSAIGRLFPEGFRKTPVVPERVDPIMCLDCGVEYSGAFSRDEIVCWIDHRFEWVVSTVPCESLRVSFFVRDSFIFSRAETASKSWWAPVSQPSASVVVLQPWDGEVAVNLPKEWGVGSFSMEMNVFRVPEWTLGENIYVGQGSGRLFGYDYAPHPVVPRMVKSSPVGGLLERVAFRRALHPSLVGDVSALRHFGDEFGFGNVRG